MMAARGLVGLWKVPVLALIFVNVGLCGSRNGTYMAVFSYFQLQNVNQTDDIALD